MSKCTRSRVRPSGTRRRGNGVCLLSSSSKRKFNYQSWVETPTNLFKKSLKKMKFSSPLLLQDHRWGKTPPLMLGKILVDSQLQDKRTVILTIDSTRGMGKGRTISLKPRIPMGCLRRETTLVTWMDLIRAVPWSKTTTLETKWK